MHVNSGIFRVLDILHEHAPIYEVVMTVNLAQPSASPKPAAQNKQALEQVFKEINADSCPRSFNFHMHTVYSDGQLRPEVLMEQAVNIGLQGLAITDHHTVGGYKVAQRWLDEWQRQQKQIELDPQSAQAPQLWTGVEINAGLLGIEVHILGYAFDPEHPHMKPYLKGCSCTGEHYPAQRAIAAIQAAGGLAVLAHPARYGRRSPAELIPEVARFGINGIETFYAYTNPKPWRPSPKQTEEIKQLSAHYGLLNTCGTDTHGSNLLLRL